MLQKGKKLLGLLVLGGVLGIAQPAMEASASDVPQGAVTFDTNYTGTVVFGADHVYTLDLTESGKVSFNVTFTGGNTHLFIVEDATGNNLASYEKRGDATFQESLDLLAGEYRIKASEYIYGANDPDYSFIVSFASAGETKSESYTAKNNEVGTATAYTLKKTVKAQFAVNDDTDIYKVSVKSNGFVKLVVNSELSAMTTELYNAMGDVKYSPEYLTVGKHSSTYFCPKGTYYIVCKAENNGTGTYTLKATSSAIPAVKLSSVKNTSGGTLTAKWSRSELVDGYQIQYATSKDFKKGKKSQSFDGKALSSGKVSGLSKGKTYYVRVRTLVKDQSGKAYYSKWSAAKSVTISK